MPVTRYENSSGFPAFTVTALGGPSGFAFSCVQMCPHLSQR